MKKRLLAAALAVLFLLPGCKKVEPPPPDAPTDKELLQSFLDGEIKAAVDKDFYHFLIYAADETLFGAENLSFQELRQLMGADSDADESGWEISYALTETMGGREMLVVRFQGQPEAEPLGSYFVFGAYDQEIRLTHAESFWNRNYAELYQDLIFIGYGSAGAGDHFNWCGYIDDEGEYRRVYTVENLAGQWVAMYAADLFGMDIDWAMDCGLYLLTTEEGEFYDLYEGANTDPEKLALLRDYLTEQQGMTEIDNVEEAMAQAKADHGVTDTPLFEDWTLWEPEAQKG